MHGELAQDAAQALLARPAGVVDGEWEALIAEEVDVAEVLVRAAVGGDAQTARVQPTRERFQELPGYFAGVVQADAAVNDAVLVEPLHVPGDHGFHQVVLGRKIHAAVDVAVGSLGVIAHVGELREALHTIGALHPCIEGQFCRFVLVGHPAEVVPRAPQRGFDNAVPVTKDRDAERLDGTRVLATPDDLVAQFGHVRDVARGCAKGDADAAAPTREVARGRCRFRHGRRSHADHPQRYRDGRPLQESRPCR